MLTVMVVTNDYDYVHGNDDCNVLTWAHNDDESGCGSVGMIMLISK